MTAANRPEGTDAEEPGDTPQSAPDGDESPAVRNKYMAFAGIFKDDPFIDDLEAYLEAERQRQRDEAGRLADLEDARAAAEKENRDMTTINKPGVMSIVTPAGAYVSRAAQDESDPDYNPYVAFAGMFEDSPFADEVEAYWQAERQREREEAARLADLEDADRLGSTDATMGMD